MNLQDVQREWTVNSSDVTLTCCVDDSDCRAQQHWARCLQHGGAGHTEHAMWSAGVICLPLNFPIPSLLTSRIHCVLSNPIIVQQYWSTELLRVWFIDRSGQALRVPRNWVCQIWRRPVNEGSRVVRPTNRPHLPPRKYSWYSFLLEAESIPGP